MRALIDCDGAVLCAISSNCSRTAVILWSHSMPTKSSIALILLSLFLLLGDTIFSHRGIFPEARAQNEHQKDLQERIVFEGGAGESPAAAVVIKGAKDIVVGIAAEYYYLEKKYGRQNVNWKLISQNLLHKQDKHFDLLIIKLVDGSQKEVYFDITEFFGKM